MAIAWRRGDPDKKDAITIWDGEHLYSTKAWVPLEYALEEFLRYYKGEGKTLVATSLVSSKTLEVQR